MRSIDVALCLLVMGGEDQGGFSYLGSVVKNTWKEYESINWLDIRTKPTWSELNVYWESNQTKFDKFYNKGII